MIIQLHYEWSILGRNSKSNGFFLWGGETGRRKKGEREREKERAYPAIDPHGLLHSSPDRLDPGPLHPPSRCRPRLVLAYLRYLRQPEISAVRICSTQAGRQGCLGRPLLHESESDSPPPTPKRAPTPCLRSRPTLFRVPHRGVAKLEAAVGSRGPAADAVDEDRVEAVGLREQLGGSGGGGLWVRGRNVGGMDGQFGERWLRRSGRKEQERGEGEGS